MLLNIKLSTDNQREVHLCYEEHMYVNKLYVRGELAKAETTDSEDKAIEMFNNEDIGETY